MDTLAHALFSGALRKKVAGQKPLSRWTFVWALWWGAFPDVFAFWPILLSMIATGSLARTPNILGIPIRTLYNYSHSIVIAILVVIIVFLIWKYVLKRGLPYAILGWPLHIIFDIPTHTPERFPVHFLYPLSDWTLPFGIYWSTIWFWILTWVVIIAIYIGYFLYRRKRSS